MSKAARELRDAFAAQDKSYDTTMKKVGGQLIDLIRQATIRPKTRRKTKPTAASQRKRLEHKSQRSQTKRQRRAGADDG